MRSRSEELDARVNGIILMRPRHLAFSAAFMLTCGHAVRRLQLIVNIRRRSDVGQVPALGGEQSVVIRGDRRCRVGHDLDVPRLHVVDRGGRAVGLDRGRSQRSGRWCGRLLRCRQHRARVALGIHRGGFAESTTQPGRRAVPLRSQPFPRFNRPGGWPARRRRHDAERLSVGRDERRGVDRRVLGAKRQCQRKSGADGWRKHAAQSVSGR